MAKIKGTALKDILVGTAFADQIFGLAGNDKIDGGAGNDKLYGGLGNDTLKGGLGNDTIFGGAGDDVITGGKGNDTLNGDDGNDTIHAGPGADVIDGGTNTTFNIPAFSASGAIAGDWLSYADSLTGVGVDLNTPVSAAGGALGDTWTNIENIRGSNFNDVLFAKDGLAGEFHAAFGGGGSDVINAGSGVGGVIMRGDGGTDFLFGNAAHTDGFWLQYGQGLDWITNFDQASDTIVVSASEFALTSLPGSSLNAGELANRSDPVFLAATDRFVYETDTHILWEDKDGSGLNFFAEAIAVIQGPGGAAIASLNAANLGIIA